MTRHITREALERLLQLARELRRRKIWTPLTSTDDGSPHPQWLAYTSEADIVGYGGAAGGGKTDLACGKALTKHQKIMLLRRVGTEMQGIEDRLESIIGNKDGFNGQKKVWKGSWRADGKKQQIEFASLPNLGDERGYQGRPHDLLVFDEAANFLEAQVRFLLGWLRTTDPTQHCQALLTFNPPTSAEGRWIIDFFAPWLDDMHPNPAAPGELRWFGTVKGKDYEVADSRPFVLVDDKPSYDFDPAQYTGKRRTEIIKPLSRTFIPSKVFDNPYLMGTGYMATLQALPEPLRSQMLNGDFKAGMQDDIWQVIPTAWVDAAMARWKPKDVLPEQDALGIDVARGGQDDTVMAARYGNWYAPLVYLPGTTTPDGQTLAAQAIVNNRDGAAILIDVIGVGASPYDILKERNQHVIGVNVAEKSTGTDMSGRLRFLNQRSELWWRMREALDPTTNSGIALPPDKRLRAELCAPTWKLQGPIIKVESREDIIDRIGRSPDAATAVVLAQLEVPKLASMSMLRRAAGATRAAGHDPYARSSRGAHDPSATSDYDPYRNLG